MCKFMGTGLDYERVQSIVATDRKSASKAKDGLRPG
jgi:hypothetical protein